MTDFEALLRERAVDNVVHEGLIYTGPATPPVWGNFLSFLTS
jgi:hypothetical protein